MSHDANDKIRVLFVCSGNICRSPMAEAVFAQRVDRAGLAERFEIASAGTGDWHVGESPHHGTLAVLRRHGVPPIAGKRAQAIDQAMLARADYIIAMDEGHVRDLRAFGYRTGGKVSRLLDYAPDAPTSDVPDPYYSGEYEGVYELVLAGTRGLLDYVRQNEGLSLRTSLADALAAAGDATPIRAMEQVGGGDINEAARIVTERGRYFVKWNLRAPPRMFEVEARGLQLLKSIQAVRVPEVIAVIDRPPALVLEWIEMRGSKSDAAGTLGEQLARQHRALGQTYGLDHDNYIGANPQPNQPTSSWIDFFRDQRLRFQMELARRKGYLGGQRASLLERLMSRLGDWIDESACAPSPLHGDLWGGNFITGPNGEPVLIDPALYYGDREADIAFSELFGGFGPRFYAAYNSVWPLQPGYADRRDLYNLYHLLNHLNLFGEGYGGSVDAILRRYAGESLHRT